MTTQYNLQQVVEQAMYSVAMVSVMSVAIGIAVAAMGTEAITGPPGTRKGIKKAIDDLRVAFGADVVNKAVEDVGYDDVLALCKEVEKNYIFKMEEMYGAYATNTALRSAPPGDIKTANEIAKALAGRGYGKYAETTAPAHVEEQAARVGTSKARKKAKPQRDTKTGIVYKSKSSAGMAVAAEYSLDPTETFIWYEVIKKDPDRFVSASQAEYEKYIQSLK
jgi:hypothetical protein